MRPFVDEEPDRVPVYRDLEDKVGRGAGLHGRPDDAVVVGVYEGLVEVQHQHLAVHHRQPVAGNLRQRGHVILDRPVLLHLKQ